MSTILLVEDDLANRTLVEDMFEFDDIGAELRCAASAEEAMTLAPDLQPILILMDVRLPGIDGLQAARLLKNDPKTGHIPIWAVTAYAMTEDREKALVAGCDDYVTKPFDAGAMKEKLRQFLGQHPAALVGKPAGAVPR
jgi:two-component system cell cycle response regulator DivK